MNKSSLDYEAQIVTIEGILEDNEKQLAYLTGKEYDPSKNADHDLLEDDIEFLENEIEEARQELKTLNHFRDKLLKKGCK